MPLNALTSITPIFDLPLSEPKYLEKKGDYHADNESSINDGLYFLVISFSKIRVKSRTIICKIKKFAKIAIEI